MQNFLNLLTVSWLRHRPWFLAGTLLNGGRMYGRQGSTKKVTPTGWQKMARALNDIPKQVYSSGLNATTWNNSTIVKAIDVEAINQFKRPDQKGLLTFGSIGLVATLIEKQLVDDYYFCIHT